VGVWDRGGYSHVPSYILTRKSHFSPRETGIEQTQEERNMKSVADHYPNTAQMYAQASRNPYHGYTWVSPKDVVRQAKKGNRINGVFPIRLFPSHHRLRESMTDTRHAMAQSIAMARGTGNMVAGFISFAIIILSLLTILTTQPGGEIPAETIQGSDDVLELENEPQLETSGEEDPAQTGSQDHPTDS